MQRLEKLVFRLEPDLRKNSICWYTSSLCRIKLQERFYASRVPQHIVPNQNRPWPNNTFSSLYTIRGNSSADMSTSVNEEFRHLDYNQFIDSKKSPNNIVIDIREKQELDETGTIPGAYHIPLGEIETALKSPEDEFKRKYNFDKPSTEHSVIFSCRSGKRSLVALEKALANGFKNAKHYRGGWLDWEKHLSQSKN